MKWSVLFVFGMVQYGFGHVMTLTTRQRCVLISCCLRHAVRVLCFFLRSLFPCRFISTINVFVLVIATVRETVFCTARLQREFTCNSSARLDRRSVELWQVSASFLSEHQNSYKTHCYRHIDNLHLSAIKYCDLCDFLIKNVLHITQYV